MSKIYTYFATCPRGLEAVLINELKDLGASKITRERGGIAFAGDMALCYRVNLHSRIAGRVMLRLCKGEYRDGDELYHLAVELPWEAWFETHQTIKVFVTAKEGLIKSPQFAGQRLKDAVCDRFREKQGQRPSVDLEHPDIRIHLYMHKQHCSIYIDTSGQTLFQRGYRRGKVEAPLRENLAAGILRLVQWKPREQALFDPMCGGGTFLIEAAHMAMNRAPGLGRYFAFEQFNDFNKGEWDEIRQQAVMAQQGMDDVLIVGSDISRKAVQATEQNLEAAGIKRFVRLEVKDALQITAPARKGMIVSNPPYGERLSEKKMLEAFYPRWSQVLKQGFKGWEVNLLSSQEELPKLMRLRAERKTPLYNGAIACRLFGFKIG